MKADAADLHIRPVMALTPCFMAGIGVGTWFAGHWAGALTAALGVAARLVAGCLRRRPVRYLPLVFFFLLGYLAIQPWTAPVFRGHSIFGHLDDGARTITGRIDAPPVPGLGSAIFLHLARPDWGPTEGCVAMARDDLLAVLAIAGPASEIDIARA